MTSGFDRVAFVEGALRYAEATAEGVDEVDRLKNVRRLSLHVLNDVFGGNEESRGLLEAAIEVLSRRKLRRFVAQPSRRSFVAVDGDWKAAKRYICFDDYCSCDDFLEVALREPDAKKRVLCRHLLAVRVAPFLTSSLEVAEVPDRDYHATISAKGSFES